MVSVGHIKRLSLNSEKSINKKSLGEFTKAVLTFNFFFRLVR